MDSSVRTAAADDDADVVVNVELVTNALGVTTPESQAIEVLLKRQFLRQGMIELALWSLVFESICYLKLQ